MISTNGSSPEPRYGTAARIVVLAYILAVAVPPLGFLLGAGVRVRLRRTHGVHGIGIMALSIVAALVWAVIIASGALNTTSTGY